jgi:flagellar basal-body rod modification protein FlgD
MTTTTTGVSGTSSAGSLTPQRNPTSSLGKDDFLKLLVGQMKNMDPLGAGNNDPSQSMAQMTQYSILEQLTNLSKSTQELAAQTKSASTIALLGRTVSYSQADGSPAEGKVDKVETAGGKLTLTIDGKPGIDPANVLEVR